MPDNYLFTTTYDFSDFTESELSEIKRAYGSLYNYAQLQILDERENLFQQARLFDMRFNVDILVRHRRKGKRYASLEDALRHLVNGNVKIRHIKRLVVISGEEVYSIFTITRKERIYVSDKTDKYSEEYLDWLYKNNLVSEVRLGWYHGKDKNIKRN